MNVNLSTVELVSTPLVVPSKGAASSSDFNDMVKGIMADLAALSTMINGSILPLVNALKDQALLPEESPVGIEGRSIYTDSSDTTALFFDPLSNTSLTLADSVRLVDSRLGTFQTQLNDVMVQVAAVQTKLASDNRNDIATALQNLVNSLTQVTNSVNTNSASIAAHEARLARFKSKRVTTGSIGAGATTAVNVTWGTAFVDNSYTVALSLEDSTGNLRIQDFNYQAAGAGLQVRVTNTGGSPTTGNIHASAHYDPEAA